MEEFEEFGAFSLDIFDIRGQIVFSAASASPHRCNWPPSPDIWPLETLPSVLTVLTFHYIIYAESSQLNPN